MSVSSDEKRCWFCNLGADQLCLKPRSQEYMVFKWYACDEQHQLEFRFIRALIHFIGGLLNIGLSTEQPCWCCKMDMQSMCLKPRRKPYELATRRYTCAGLPLMHFQISGNLVRGIATLLNRKG
jgi:hypothetical protein